MRRIVPMVLNQHLDEAHHLWSTRTALSVAANAGLRQLRGFDDRLAANLEGLREAADEGTPLIAASLDGPTSASMFVATVHALLSSDGARSQKLVAVARATPAIRAGLFSAYGWVSAASLVNVARTLLESREPFEGTVGIAACAMHRVDPGKRLETALSGSSEELRARALRATGELGRLDLIGHLYQHLAATDASSAFWAARTAVLLGDRARALQALADIGMADGPHATAAFSLALQAMPVGASVAVVRELARNGRNRRRVVQGGGLVGDPVIVPWLIGQMQVPAMARIAAEAFALITGADLAELNLEAAAAPEGADAGPSADADDDNVAMDPDDGLPWPDPAKVEGWWHANAGRFQKHQRYFLGAPVTRGHCIDVLRNGRQRQRMLTALHLCLLEPGTSLFSTRAPAWRQERWLAALDN